jgi:hypothetical protein
MDSSLVFISHVAAGSRIIVVWCTGVKEAVLTAQYYRFALATRDKDTSRPIEDIFL